MDNINNNRYYRDKEARPWRWILIMIIATAGPFLVSGTASADRRIFPYTYPYMTLPQGAFEVEHYLSAKYYRADDPGTAFMEDEIEVEWEHQVEFEYGITDHTDFGFYNVFRQKPFQPMKYRGIKLRTRHRFAEQGDWPIDVGFYLEFIYFDNELKLEKKLLLAKTMGNLEIDLNIILEEEWPEADEGSMYEGDFGVTEVEFKTTLGIGYHFTESLAIGLQYIGETEREGDEEWSGFLQHLGPAISISTKKFWWTMAFAPQISDFDDVTLFQARSIFGIYL